MKKQLIIKETVFYMTLMLNTRVERTPGGKIEHTIMVKWADDLGRPFTIMFIVDARKNMTEQYKALEAQLIEAVNTKQSIDEAIFSQLGFV